MLAEPHADCSVAYAKHRTVESGDVLTRTCNDIVWKGWSRNTSTLLANGQHRICNKEKDCSRSCQKERFLV